MLNAIVAVRDFPYHVQPVSLFLADPRLLLVCFTNLSPIACQVDDSPATDNVVLHCQPVLQEGHTSHE